MPGFLGRGYDYPLKLAGDGKFKMVEGPEKVRASIYAILDTPVGTRIMLREFGCRIHEINFNNDEDVTAALAEFYTREALEQWEPRIEVPEDGISITFQDSKMYIHIRYTIIETNTEDNMVYPFHLEEVA